MQYMGGKSRIAKQIVSAILADTDKRYAWMEPFVGGGNVMEHAAPHFQFPYGADAHVDLIMMWQHASSGGSLPEMITRDEYQSLRASEPSPLRGFAGFAGSFGGKWFGGYGMRGGVEPVIKNGYRSVTRQAKVFADNSVRFRCETFGTTEPPKGCVVYCDPPYAGTTGYSTSKGFDYEAFYRTLIDWSGRADVYVSEYAIPDWVPAKTIWESPKGNALRLTGAHSIAHERLFRIQP